MTRVLVSGGSGFIGLPTLGALAASGHEVHALTSRRDPPALDGVAWVACDLSEPRAVAAAVAAVAPESLLHLAWYVEHGRFWSAPENADWVERSLALLRAFAAYGGRRVVMLGSCAEYDWSSGAERFDEQTTPLRPATLYGAAKDGLRRIGDAYAQQLGLEFAWGRLFFLYGPREPPGRLVPAVIRALLAGEPAEVSSGRQIRDLLYVDDVAGALAALLASDVCGAVNIASGEPIALREVVAEIGRLVGHEDQIRTGALADRPEEPERIVASVSRLADEVGFERAFTLRAGLERAVSWWREAQPAPRA